MINLNAYRDLKILWDSFEDCQEELEEIATLAYVSKAIELPFWEGISLDCLDLAFDLDIIHVENQRISFHNTQFLLYIIAHVLIKKKLINDWNNIEQLVSKLNYIRLEGYNWEQIKNLHAVVLLILNNEYDKDICSLISSLSPDDKNLFWDIFHSFTSVLPYLEMKINSLADALEKTLDFIKNDLAGGEIYRAIEKLGDEQPDFALDLFDYIKAHPSSDLASVIPSIIVGLSRKHKLEYVWKLAFSLIHAENPLLTCAGILACSRLDYSAEPINTLLEPTMNEFEEKLSEEDGDILAALVQGFGNLLKYDKKASEHFVALSKLQLPNVQYAVSHILFQKMDKHSLEKWFKESLTDLSVVNSDYKGIIKNIDMVLYFCSTSDPDLTCSFLESWVLNRNYGIDREPKLSDIFGQPILNLYNQQKGKLERFLTNWFNSDDPRLNLAASDIIQELIVHRRADLTLSKEILDNLLLKDIKFLGLRIMGHVFDGQFLCALVFSILQRSPEDEKVNEFITNLFDEYISYNYPQATKEYLNKKIEGGSEVERKIAKEILEALESYQTKLAELARLREFEPSERRASYFLREKQKVFSAKMQNGVSEKSIFLKLVTKVILKGGRKAFAKVKDNYIEMELKEMSFQTEFPRGEYIDPVLQAFKRRLWRTIKRDEIDEIGDS